MIVAQKIQSFLWVWKSYEALLEENWGMMPGNEILPLQRQGPEVVIENSGFELTKPDENDTNMSDHGLNAGSGPM